MENIQTQSSKRKKLYAIDGDTFVRLAGEQEADEYLNKGYQAKLSKRLEELGIKPRNIDEAKRAKKREVKIIEVEPNL